MGLEFKKKKIAARKSTTRLIASGFALIILAGALLLTLPIANKSGHGNLLNSLFTATSATCVTGLVVADTYRNWTIFGQLVILCLIQVGGLGFMTIGAYISVLFKKRIGLQEREQLQESVNTLEIAGVVRLVKKIVQGALCIEGLGAVLLACRFIPRFGVARGIYFSIFHAVSAFCNGGFDLMGVNEAYSSLVAFEGDIVVNLVVVTLILVGGIGFIVWDDVVRNKWHFRKDRDHNDAAPDDCGDGTVSGHGEPGGFCGNESAGKISGGAVLLSHTQDSRVQFCRHGSAVQFRQNNNNGYDVCRRQSGFHGRRCQDDIGGRTFVLCGGDGAEQGRYQPLRETLVGRSGEKGKRGCHYQRDTDDHSNDIYYDITTVIEF